MLNIGKYLGNYIRGFGIFSLGLTIFTLFVIELIQYQTVDGIVPHLLDEDMMWHHAAIFSVIPISLGYAVYYERKRTLKKEIDKTTLELNQEIIAHKESDTALLESEDKYRVLVENSPNLIMIFQNGYAKYVNKAMSEKLGWSSNEMTMSSFNLIEKIGTPRFQKKIRKSIDDLSIVDRIHPFDTNLKTIDNQNIAVTVLGQEIAYHGSPAIEFIFVDISDRKKAESEKMLLLEKITNSLGHDLHSTLQSINQATKNLIDSSDNKKKKNLDLINKNIDVANKVIEEIINIQHNAALSQGSVDINGLIDEIKSETMVPSNVKFHLILDELPLAKLDQVRIKQALLNLILNSLKAMPDGGEIIISTKLLDESIEIEVADTGKGISSNNIDKIFKPIYSSEVDGIGLGLVNTKRIIEDHLGSISLESKEGKGTRVKVKLPIN